MMCLLRLSSFFMLIVYRPFWHIRSRTTLALPNHHFKECFTVRIVSALQKPKLKSWCLVSPCPSTCPPSPVLLTCLLQIVSPWVLRLGPRWSQIRELLTPASLLQYTDTDWGSWDTFDKLTRSGFISCCSHCPPEFAPVTRIQMYLWPGANILREF